MKLLRVVVASPGDVKPERDSVESVAEELNRGLGDLLGIRLEVVRWETDAFPGFDRGGSQAQIDRGLQVPDSDLLIGIFWKRFGTPVPGAKSGSEHEIRSAYRAWQETGQPQIMVYFNQQKPAGLPAEEEAQWQAVRTFQKDPIFQQGLWWAYEGAAQFEKLVRAHLTQYLKHRVTPVESQVRTLETPLGTMDVSQPRTARTQSLAEIAPGLRHFRSEALGFEIGWPPAGWEPMIEPFQLGQLQGQLRLPPTVRLGFLLLSSQAAGGFRPNVNVIAERVGAMSIRDYLVACTSAMQAAGQHVVSAEPDDATQGGVIVFYGRDPLGRELFQFQRLLITNGVCLIATASQLPPMDLVGQQMRTELASILNTLRGL